MDLVPVANTLSQEKEFLQENRDIFSGLPGLIRVIEHDIATEPIVKFQAKPILIVLIPKPNGILQFCNYFRELNEVHI